MAHQTWLPNTPINGLDSAHIPVARPPLPVLRDSTHVDGLELVPELHVLHTISVDGRQFSRCTCGYVAEWFHSAPRCAVEEAESEKRIALWCAEKRIQAARARGERATAALADALAGERR